MVKLQIPKQQRLKKTAKRGNYSEAEKKELMSIPKDKNLTLELKATASKWNRDFANVKRMYYRLQSLKNDIIDSESNKEQSIPVFTVSKTKENVSKFSPTENAWTDWETELVMEAMSNAKNKSKASVELSELIDRTPAAIRGRYSYLNRKNKVEPKESSLIPELDTNTFLEEVNVKMYRATIAGTNHEKAQDAVKANIRTILDSYDELRNLPNADDAICHKWFFENKEMINYLLNTNPEELWS